MIFESLPQNFIADVTIDHNKPYFKYSMRKLLTMIFGNKAKDKEKIDINIKVLNYLDNNLEIKKNSGVELLLNKSYEETIKEYVNGQLFEKDIDKLKIEGENEEFKNVVKRAQTTSDVVIVNEIPKRDALVLLKEGIKYFVKGR